MKCFKNVFLSVMCLLLFVSVSGASEIGIANFAQSELDSFGKQVGFLLARRQYKGANPLGLIGFDIGVEATAVKLDDTSLWNKSYSTSSAPSYLLLPAAHIRKGLPFNIDVGLRGGMAPNADLSLLGGEINYAPLAGSVITPAVNLFLAYSILDGGKNFDLNSTSLGASVSKGIGIITPYAGISYDRTKLSVKGSSLLLQNTTGSGMRQFAGVRLNVIIFSLCAEANFGEMKSYGLSLDFGI